MFVLLSEMRKGFEAPTDLSLSAQIMNKSAVERDTFLRIYPEKLGPTAAERLTLGLL